VTALADPTRSDRQCLEERLAELRELATLMRGDEGTWRLASVPAPDGSSGPAAAMRASMRSS
jgi:hypothetical protein